MTSSTLPAILGGTPLRTKPYPPPYFIGPEERALVNDVLDSGVLSGYVAHHGPHFGGGPMVHALEAEICKVFGVKHAVTVNSATSGLHAAVCAALAGLGDEVIVPPYTMSATATTVACANATPIFADIQPDTFCIDEADVRRNITPRTKAIVAVNLFGGPAQLEKLRALADEKRLVLIEDNAQAPGGARKGKLTGTYGDMAVLSFNCHKTVQCGEGGAVLTNDDTFADRLRLVRNHGEVVLSQREAVPEEISGLLGYNYRLTELQSAVALAQLRKLDALTRGRIEMADVITSRLSRIDGITAPHVARGDRHVYYLYAFKVDRARLGLSRAQLKAALDAEGIASAEGYVRPIYLYPMYEARVAKQRQGLGAGVWHPGEQRQRYAAGLCPVTERMHFEELLTTNICSSRSDTGRRPGTRPRRGEDRGAPSARPRRAGCARDRVTEGRGRLLLTGATGLLGTAIVDAWANRWDITATARRRRIERSAVCCVHADMAAPGGLAELVIRERPRVVVHCAAWTDVDGCEENPALARTLHRDATYELAKGAREAGAAFVYVSTDSVFSDANKAHRETDSTAPLSVYAKSKREGEEACLATCERTLVVRTCVVGWSAQPRPTLVEWILGELRANRIVRAFTDVFFTPVLSTTLAGAIERLVVRGQTGIVHVGGRDCISKYDFARELAVGFTLRKERVVASSIRDAKLRAPRPLRPCLDSSRYAALVGDELQSVREAIAELRRLEASGWRDSVRASVVG